MNSKHRAGCTPEAPKEKEDISGSDQFLLSVKIELDLSELVFSIILWEIIIIIATILFEGTGSKEKKIDFGEKFMLEAREGN